MEDARISIVFHYEDAQKISVLLVESGFRAIGSTRTGTTGGGSSEAEHSDRTKCSKQAKEQYQNWQDAAAALKHIESRLEPLIERINITADSVMNESPACEESIRPLLDAPLFEQHIAEMEEDIQAWETEKEKNDSELEYAKQLQNDRTYLDHAGVSVRAISSISLLHFIMGWIPKQEQEKIESPITRTPFAIIPLWEEDGRLLVAAASKKEAEFTLSKILDALFFLPLHVFKGEVFPEKALSECDDRVKSLEKQKKEIEKAREKRVKKWTGPSREILGKIKKDIRAADIIAGAALSDSYYSVSGFVRKKDADALYKSLQKTATHPYAFFTSSELEEAS